MSPLASAVVTAAMGMQAVEDCEVARKTGYLECNATLMACVAAPSTFTATSCEQEAVLQRLTQVWQMDQQRAPHYNISCRLFP